MELKEILEEFITRLDSAVLMVEQNGQIFCLNTIVKEFLGIDEKDDGRQFLNLELFNQDGIPIKTFGKIFRDVCDGGDLTNEYFVIAPKNRRRRDVLISAYMLSGISVCTFVIKDVTNFVRQQLQLKDLGLYDPLTGLANRLLLLDRLATAIEIARRERLFLAVLILDILNFSNINFKYGYQNGDRVLLSCARTLQSQLRPQDTIARYSGGQFAVSFLVEQEDEIKAIIERILKALSYPILVGETDVVLQFEYGLCSMAPEEPGAPETLLLCADNSLRKSRLGRYLKNG